VRLTDNPDADPDSDAKLRAGMAVIAGYVAACLATVLGFFGSAWALGGGGPLLLQGFSVVLVSFGLVLVLALPGFVAIRLGLYLARRKDLLSFAIAGGLNGVAAIGAMWVFDWISGAGPPVTSPWNMLLGLISLGVVAGLVCWVVEHSIAGRVASKGEG
jgi:hypothetical protein